MRTEELKAVGPEVVIEALQQLGGKEWIKDEFHRIYFNNLEKLYGLDCQYYKTGNIARASLNGEPISNSEARRILGCLCDLKVWFDVKDLKPHFFVQGQRDPRKFAIARAIISRIEEKLKACAPESENLTEEAEAN